MDTLKHKRIFVDMDGVLAGFDEHYLKVFGKDIRVKGAVSDDELWANVDSYDGDFFYDLPVLAGAREGVQFLKDNGYEVVYLTACPASNYGYVAQQKHDWIRMVFGDEESLVIPIVGGKNKAKVLQFQGDILIDDYRKNTQAWADAGGNPILHTDWSTTLDMLHTMIPLKV